jgi:bifunctional polynucleotide phosphatase/kinase
MPNVAGRRTRSPDAGAAATRPAVAVADWVVLGDSKSVLWLNAERIANRNAAPRDSVKVASFDLDDTLIMPKSGAVFAKSSLDWKWLIDGVPEKLAQAHRDGFVIVVFTNQAGIKDDASKRLTLQEKCSAVNNAAGGVPISVMASTHDDIFRKPASTMWTLLRDRFRAEGVLSATGELDRAASYYVGDAAGRAIKTLAGRAKDFSCGDRKFALNVGIKFFTPEEYFLGRAPEPNFVWDGPSPAEVAALVQPPTPAELAANAKPAPAGERDLIVMVGQQGSGKSSFYRLVLQPAGYVHVNRDTLGTAAKCLAAAEAALKGSKSVCVDNTSPSAEDRKPYIALAKKHGAKARAVVMTTSNEVAEHLARFRELYCGGPHIPGMAVGMYRKRHEEPTVAEGFAAVERFTPRIDATKLTPEQRAGLAELS